VAVLSSIVVATSYRKSLQLRIDDVASIRLNLTETCEFYSTIIISKDSRSGEMIERVGLVAYLA